MNIMGRHVPRLMGIWRIRNFHNWRPAFDF